MYDGLTQFPFCYPNDLEINRSIIGLPIVSASECLALPIFPPQSWTMNFGIWPRLHRKTGESKGNNQDKCTSLCDHANNSHDLVRERLPTILWIANHIQFNKKRRTHLWSIQSNGGSPKFFISKWQCLIVSYSLAARHSLVVQMMLGGPQVCSILRQDSLC